MTEATSTESVNRVILCPLESSQRKTNRVCECVDEWQTILSRMGDLLPTFPEHRWGNTQDTHLYRLMKSEFPELGLRSIDALEAAKKATESFDAWKSNGKPGDRPQFAGDGGYMRVHNSSLALERNDQEWGLKVGLQPYKPEWFRIDASEYHREYLDRVVEDEAELGASELRFDENGNITAALTITEEKEVYVPENVLRTVGVDIGETTLYAAAVTESETEAVRDVLVEPGREFRHVRERLKRKRSNLMQEGDLRGVQQCRDEHRRYTEHVLHTASREIIELANDHEPCTIFLEELTHYRSTANDPIHDWPFALFQELIEYKATAAGVPVVHVNPAYTSRSCRKCGQQDPESRSGTEFSCRRCGYTVHADVNAAINLSLK